jgi:hypothetical protein
MYTSTFLHKQLSGRGEGVDPSAWSIFAPPIDFFLKVSSDTHGILPVQGSLPTGNYLRIHKRRIGRRDFGLRWLTDEGTLNQRFQTIRTLVVTLARSTRVLARLWQCSESKKKTVCSENALSPRLVVRVFSTTDPCFRSGCCEGAAIRSKPRPSLAVQNYPRLSFVGSILFQLLPTLRWLDNSSSVTSSLPRILE